jgi:hypothetical protein
MCYYSTVLVRESMSQYLGICGALGPALRTERAGYSSPTLADMNVIPSFKHSASFSTDTTARMGFGRVAVTGLCVANVSRGAGGVKISRDDHAQALFILECGNEALEACLLAAQGRDAQNCTGRTTIAAGTAKLLAPVRESAHKINVHYTIKCENVQPHAHCVRGKEAARVGVSLHEVAAQVVFALIGRCRHEIVHSFVTTSFGVILSNSGGYMHTQRRRLIPCL